MTRIMTTIQTNKFVCRGYRQLIVTEKLNEGFMIWGHDPPRTHEKITGKTESFRAFCLL